MTIAGLRSPSCATRRRTCWPMPSQDLFPEAKPTIGPAIENGFYYDFDRDDAVHAR